jgi:hypothetical protein
MRTLLLTALVAALAVPSLRPQPSPSPGSYRMRSLFDASDAVCLGTIVRSDEPVHWQAASAGKAETKAFSLSIARCYKGSVLSGDVIEYPGYDPGVDAHPAAMKGDTALVFLKASGDGRFKTADPWWWRLYDVSLPTLALEEGTGLKQLESDIACSLAVLSEPEAVSRELRALHGFDQWPQETLASVRAYTKDADRRLALAAFSILVEAGLPEDLSALCHYAQDPGLDSLAWAFDVRLEEIRSPAARAALECLARTPARAIKYRALDALRAMKSPASVPALIGLLDDSDSYAEFLAYMTLCEIVRRKEDMGEGASGFATNRDAIVASWKQWWSEKGRALYPEAGR